LKNGCFSGLGSLGSAGSTGSFGLRENEISYFRKDCFSGSGSLGATGSSASTTSGDSFRLREN